MPRCSQIRRIRSILCFTFSSLMQRRNKHLWILWVNWKAIILTEPLSSPFATLFPNYQQIHNSFVCCTEWHRSPNRIMSIDAQLWLKLISIENVWFGASLVAKLTRRNGLLTLLQHQQPTGNDFLVKWSMLQTPGRHCLYIVLGVFQICQTFFEFRRIEFIFAVRFVHDFRSFHTRECKQ